MRLRNNKVHIDRALACFSYAIELYQNTKGEHKPATIPRTLVSSGERHSASGRRPECGHDWLGRFSRSASSPRRSASRLLRVPVDRRAPSTTKSAFHHKAQDWGHRPVLGRSSGRGEEGTDALPFCSKSGRLCAHLIIAERLRAEARFPLATTMPQRDRTSQSDSLHLAQCNLVLCPVI
jgi:hypothetical protein